MRVSRAGTTYQSWVAMKSRCLNARDAGYPRYGGAGITVCARWRASYAAFLADMGERPPGMTLDRVDGTRGYEPGNCRWATARQQVANRRVMRPRRRVLVDPIPRWLA